LAFNSESQHHHFHRLFSGCKDEDLPKAFKGLLADYFSYMNKQDRPEVPFTGNKLFYSRYQKRITQRLLKDKRFCVKATWDLMQSKSLAAEVPESFIRSALLKHRETVSKVTETDPELLSEFSDFCRPVMEKAAQLLEHTMYPLPNQHSCYETPRSKSGVLRNWEFREGCVTQPVSPRLDPYTVLVTGPPGCGKSLMQAKVSRLLANRLKTTVPEAVYCRNADVKHWDGYKYQPMVIIDDFLQGRVCNQENPAVTEFVALNSSVDYILPMAELKEKGRNFTSPLILYSSNMSLGQAITQLNIKLCLKEAIARRVDLCIEFSHKAWFAKRYTYKSDGSLEPSTLHTSSTWQDMSKWLESHLYSQWSSKSVTYAELFDELELVPLRGTGSSYLKVPDIDHHNKVKVSAILEPLKVRTITIGTAKNFILKPLQECLLAALRDYPEFKPCFTPEYSKELFALAQNSDLCLSGDYSSATDGLHSDLYRSGFKHLLPLLKPYLRDIVEKETGVHFVEYPKDFKIPPVHQTNGQLMGSLLSFPLLCLANAFTLYKSTGKNLGSIPALLHGDDVAAFISEDEISSWKTFCPQIGLSLSLGKNYVSPDWVSIDSQLYHIPSETRLTTGKYTCYQAKNEQMITQLLLKGLPKPLVVSIAQRSGLFSSKGEYATPRSVDVSTEFGGLGLEGEPFDHLSRTVWEHKVRHTILKRKLDQGYVYQVPTYVRREYDLVITPSELREKQTEREKQKNSCWKLIKYYKRLGIECEAPSFPLPQVGCVFRHDRDPVLENVVQNEIRKYTNYRSDFPLY